MCENNNIIIWSIKMTASFNKCWVKISCIISFCFLISCDGKVPIIASGVSGTEGLPVEEASFAKFDDLPMPNNSKMNIGKSLLFGSESDWFGRLDLIVSMSGAEVFDFYRFEMPNFGWKEITSIRSDISLITYERGERIATVRIDSSSTRGTEVSVTVSPRVTGGNISK
jgi:hypothetical protein